MPSGRHVPLAVRRKHASWVLAARSAVSKLMLWMPIWSAELRGIPDDVVREIRALRPEQPRLRSSRLGRVKGPAWLVRMEPPAHARGFHRVMAAIAAHAGCKPATLYLWVEEYVAYRASMQLSPKERASPRGRRARRLSGDAYEHTEIPLTQRQRQLRQLVDTTLRRDDEIPDQPEPPHPKVRHHEISADALRLLRVPAEQRDLRQKLALVRHLEAEFGARGAGALHVHTEGLTPQQIQLRKYEYLMENLEALWELFPPAPEL
jgi:hypothetical protein